MATYKVIQDIEAEDKLLGPLTFRQFVYAGIAVIFFYLSFLVTTKGAAFMSAVFLPAGLISGFLAWPWSRDQPTEIWALAKIRFMIKPRRRIWNQSGVKELVTITAPKKIEAVYTNGLSQDEVQNRLRALADTIDSRGWAIKNVNVNMYAQPAAVLPQTVSDRLVEASELPQEVSEIEVHASDDILDEHNNPVARQFDTMLDASTKARRDQIMESMRQVDAPAPAAAPQPQQQPAGPANNYWFLNQPTPGRADVAQNAVTFNTQVVTPGNEGFAGEAVPEPTSAEEAAVLEQIREQERRENAINPYTHWHTITPLSEQANGPQPQQQAAQPSMANAAQGSGATGIAPGQQQWRAVLPSATPFDPTQQMGQTQQQTAQPQVTPATDPAILQLASNDDLNVATIAREANKRKDELRDEVVISLH